MRLIDADELRKKFYGYKTENGIDVALDHYAVSCIDNAPTVKPTLYGYPIEHLEMIARVMAKENCTPEDVARLLQNAGEVAKAVRDEMMEMLRVVL